MVDKLQFVARKLSSSYLEQSRCTVSSKISNEIEYNIVSFAAQDDCLKARWIFAF